jgi:hypothetical protein
MGRWAWLLLLGVTGVATACAPVAGPRAIVAEDDRYQPYTEWRTEPHRVLDMGRQVTLALFGRADRKTGTETFVLFADIAYQTPGRALHMFEQARNTRAEPLPVRVLVREGRGCERAGGCSKFERLEITLPTADIRTLERGSYGIKIFARAGNAIEIALKAETVGALLAQMDARRAATASAAPGAPPER